MPGRDSGDLPGAAFQKELILTLIITILVEGIIVSAYSIWRKKPLGPILFTSVCANLITQCFLWAVLRLFFRHYLVALSIAELTIWISESFLLYRLPANQLDLREATLLSVLMNVASFSLGWFLPV